MPPFALREAYLLMLSSIEITRFPVKFARKVLAIYSLLQIPSLPKDLKQMNISKIQDRGGLVP